MFYLEFLFGKKFRRWYIRVVGLILHCAIYGLMCALLGWLPALLVIIFASAVALWVKFILEDLAEKERLEKF